jgi:ATP-dependent RNA helicase DDX52/ROK1
MQEFKEEMISSNENNKTKDNKTKEIVKAPQKEKKEIGDALIQQWTSEQVSLFRKQQKIKVYGNDIPWPIQSFEELFQKFKLKSYLKRNILEFFQDPTPIQMQATTVMLHASILLKYLYIYIYIKDIKNSFVIRKGKSWLVHLQVPEKH